MQSAVAVGKTPNNIIPSSYYFRALRTTCRSAVSRTPTNSSRLPTSWNFITTIAPGSARRRHYGVNSYTDGWAWISKRLGLLDTALRSRHQVIALFQSTKSEQFHPSKFSFEKTTLQTRRRAKEGRDAGADSRAPHRETFNVGVR
jgi:hypothetical protein